MKIGIVCGILGAALAMPVASTRAGECNQGEYDAGGIAAHIFDISDLDQNEELSPSEYEAAELDRYGVSFEAFDANGDGATSFDEYMDLFEIHHAPKEVI